MNVVSPADGLVLRSMTPTDRLGLAAMLAALSPRAAYQRFFTGGFRVTEPVLDVLTCRGRSGRAFVAVRDDEVVAHAMWATSFRAPSLADIAFVVAAGHRGRGLANTLTELALADAGESGPSQVTATVLVDNQAAHRVVHRLLPCAVALRDGDEMEYVATLAETRASSPGEQVTRSAVSS